MTTLEAIKWAGGTQLLLAQKLGIKQPSVSVWGEYPPDEQQLRLQLLSNGHLQAEPGVINKKTERATA